MPRSAARALARGEASTRSPRGRSGEAEAVVPAGGAGFGVLNNPSGFTVEGRAGAYPLMSHSDASRSGLMVGVDVKTVFASAATGIVVMGCIGYESF